MKRRWRHVRAGAWLRASAHDPCFAVLRQGACLRLTRRQSLAMIAGSACVPMSMAIAQGPGTVPIEVKAIPLAAFEPRNPDRRKFGQLTWRSGLQLSADQKRFGGFSGLWRSGDGRQLVTVTDQGWWLTANVETKAGRLQGLSQATMAPVLGQTRPLHQSRSYDTEGLTIVDGVAYLCVERAHEIWRFDWAKDGVMARGRSLPVPSELKKLPSNRSLEAIGIAPAGSPVAGAIVTIAERSGDTEEPTLGAIIGGPKPGLFTVRRHNGYDITDLAFLPGGDMLLLERWYRPLLGVGMRIRRVVAARLLPGAVVDGPTLIEADLGQEIDNMEGMSIHREGGQTILTLISDDNFSAIQRTVLLEFVLD